MADEKEVKEMKEEEKDSTDVVNKESRSCCAGKHSPWMAVLIIIAVVLVVGAAFAAGHAGSRRGNFNRIGSGRGAMMEGRGFGSGRMMSGQAIGTNPLLRVSGTVSAINGNNLTVKTSSNDMTVTTTDQTSYLKAGVIAKQSDLKVNDTIVASGQSNAAGEIAASVINIR